MSTIWKYSLKARESSHVPLVMPAGTELLDVHEQYEDICIWARVDPNQPANEVRAFAVFETGTSLNVNGSHKYLGTAHLHDGDTVLHVFEVTP
jgi:hypothetical protein